MTNGYKRERTGVFWQSCLKPQSHGGHSGDEIHKGYGNSIKIISRLVQDLEKKYDIRISNFSGGNLRNAIPREAFVTVTFNPTHEENILADTAAYHTLVRDEYNGLDRSIIISKSRRVGLLSGKALLPGFAAHRHAYRIFFHDTNMHT